MSKILLPGEILYRPVYLEDGTPCIKQFIITHYKYFDNLNRSHYMFKNGGCSVNSIGSNYFTTIKEAEERLIK
jgi:hypothetical protein